MDDNIVIWNNVTTEQRQQRATWWLGCKITFSCTNISDPPSNQQMPWQLENRITFVGCSLLLFTQFVGFYESGKKTQLQDQNQILTHKESCGFHCFIALSVQAYEHSSQTYWGISCSFCAKINRKSDVLPCCLSRPGMENISYSHSELIQWFIKKHIVILKTMTGN